MKKLALLIGLVAFAACGDRNTTVIDQQVLEEMNQREPKRVLPDQLVRAAYRRGRALADELRSSATQRYPDKTTATSFGEYLARQSYDTSSARVVWVGYGSDTTQLTGYEQQLWGAYRYSAERGDPLADNVQRLSGDSLLYTQPLIVTDSLRQQLATSTTDTLGQLLGMWSITLPKKEVVLAIE